MNANHVRAAARRLGDGNGAAPASQPVEQVWGIELCDDAGRLTCISRLTIAVLARPGPDPRHDTAPQA